MMKLHPGLFMGRLLRRGPLVLVFFAALSLPAMPRGEGRASAPPPTVSGGIYGISPGPDGNRVFSDVLGRKLTTKGEFRRIVSLSPGVTEILFAIGAGEQTVGITEYCNYPPEAQGLTRVGGFSGATVSMEQVAALKADLVVVSGDMHGRIISLLDELAIASFAVEPRNFGQVYETITILGELTGRTEGAAAVVREMQAKIAQAEERARGRERPEIFWILQEEPLMSIGGSTFITEAIELAGGRNIFGDLEEQWPLISAEQVLLRRPGLILAGDDMGTLDPAALARRPGWGDIPAVKNGRIVLISADTLYRYGPRLADGVLIISKIVFP